MSWDFLGPASIGPGSYKGPVQPNTLESLATAGDSPVGERQDPPGKLPSRPGHVKPGLNPRGPPRKAKYYLATDSEPVARAKMVKSTPARGVKQYLKPRAYKPWKGYGLRAMPDRVPFA